MTEILTITIPALLVLLTAYLLISKLLKNDEKRRHFEIQKKTLNVSLPIKLRAYERMVLVLERTKPTQLILNNGVVGMTNSQLQSQLLTIIRQEFSHNYSQQIYMSNEAWQYIKAAQESLLQLVNTCAQKCDPEASANILSEMVIGVFDNSENTPTELAIEKLKSEVQSFM